MRPGGGIKTNLHPVLAKPQITIFFVQQLKLPTKRYGTKIGNTACLFFQIFNVFVFSHLWCKYLVR